jgi:molybdopterin-dependent oxidoreductase alpha subunit
MLTGKETKISDQYHQLKAGGDVAAILGLCKCVVEADDAARAAGKAEVIDHAFVKQHTTGFDAFIQSCRDVTWAEIEQESGLTEAALRDAADVYIAAEKVIGVYGMGLTQHTHGALNIAMLVNLLLLRGNIGKPGAGCCPVRGHSNVQGQRTVGIAEKVKLVPLDKLKELFGFDPPTKDGMNIVEAVEGMFAGKVRAFVSLGGNLVRAVPDQKRMEQAWAAQDLTVMISTKLNRSHLFPAKQAYILPCLGRFEVDQQATGNQSITTEDSFSMISASVGHTAPVSDVVKSELAIVTGIAKATVATSPGLKWDEWTADYGLVRDLIEQTYPDDFRDYNARMYEAGGFYRGNGAHERIWKTPEGKAVFTTPGQLNSLGFKDAPGRYRLITLRSNDQFNTTIYGYSDRLRGLEGSRDIVLMSPEDIEARGFHDGQRVTLVTDVDADDDDGQDRRLGGLTLTAYKLPRGTIASYYPECNVLVPIGHHDQLSKTPASKSVPVRVEAG